MDKSTQLDLPRRLTRLQQPLENVSDLDRTVDYTVLFLQIRDKKARSRTCLSGSLSH